MRCARRELVAAAHIVFPGLVHIRKDGATYRWVPANTPSL